MTFRRVILGLSVLGLSACGRYLKPVAPEMVAPDSVISLDAAIIPSGVAFTWTAPDKDQRGKELEEVDGYAVMRKEIVERGDETNPDIPFEQIAFLQDKHIEERDRLRDEARAAGKLGRRIQAPSEMKAFSYVDTTTTKGATYLYRIEPRAMGGVKGGIDKVIRVVLKTDPPDIDVIDVKDLSEMVTGH